MSVPNDVHRFGFDMKPISESGEFLRGFLYDGRFACLGRHRNPRPPVGNHFGSRHRYGFYRRRPVRAYVFRRDPLRRLRYGRLLERNFRFRVRMRDVMIRRMKRLRFHEARSFPNRARNARFPPAGFERKPQNVRLRDLVFGSSRRTQHCLNIRFQCSRKRFRGLLKAFP